MRGGSGRVARIVRELGAPDHACEPLPVRVDAARPPSLCRRGSAYTFAGAAMRNWLPSRGRSTSDRAERQVAGALEEHRIEQCDVDVLAFARAVAMAERGDRGERGVQPGEVVAQKGRRLHRLAIGRAVQREEAARGLRERVVARAVVITAVLPEAADRDQNDVVLARAQLFPADAPAVERAGTEVLDHEVGAAAQVEKDLAAPWRVEIEREAALVTVERRLHERERRLRAGQERRRAARDLSGRVLDLDHVGAVIGEDAASHRARPRGGELDHTHARERTRQVVARFAEEIRFVQDETLSAGEPRARALDRAAQIHIRARSGGRCLEARARLRGHVLGVRRPELAQRERGEPARGGVGVVREHV